MLGAKIFSRSLFRESYHILSAKEFFSGLGTDSMILRNIMRINPFEKKSRNKNAIILTALSCWKNERRELRISLGVVNEVQLGLVRIRKAFEAFTNFIIKCEILWLSSFFISPSAE